MNVPHPARFAVHKLLVAQDRPVAFQAKSRKDASQAAQVLLALEELRPGDVALAAPRSSSASMPMLHGCSQEPR